MKYQTGKKLFEVRREGDQEGVSRPAFNISRRLIYEEKLHVNISYEISDW
jgi:hypothetical protein